eukprot:UN5075
MLICSCTAAFFVISYMALYLDSRLVHQPSFHSLGHLFTEPPRSQSRFVLACFIKF